MNAGDAAQFCLFVADVTRRVVFGELFGEACVRHFVRLDFGDCSDAEAFLVRVGGVEDQDRLAKLDRRGCAVGQNAIGGIY